MAIRMMVEKAAISNRLAVHAKERHRQDREAYFLSVAKEAEAEAERIRAAWLDGRAQSSKDESAGEQ
jgi:predicted transposase YbfD/YdcC